MTLPSESSFTVYPTAVNFLLKLALNLIILKFVYYQYTLIIPKTYSYKNYLEKSANKSKYKDTWGVIILTRDYT